MSPSFAGVFRPIPGLLREAIPPELGTFEWSASSSMAKAWFGNRSLHYEIWVRHGLKVVELGLHFESDALSPCVLASVIAYSVVISLFGESTLFAHAEHDSFVRGIYGV